MLEKMSGEQSSISAEEGDRSAIAHAQWKCIDQLAAQYKYKKIRGTDNNFEDDKWIDSNNRKLISWSTIVDNDNSQALLLLLKIGAYHQIESRKNTIFTMCGTLSTFMVLLNDVIKNKYILVGRKNELLLGFNEISTTDLRQAIDERIILGYSIKNHMVSVLGFVKEIPRQEINNLPIFTANYDYPWKGNKLLDWVNKRHSDLGISLPEIKPYLSMPLGTTQPIIERSMDMIVNHGENILAIHNMAMEFDDSNYRAFFHSKYGVAFMKSISGTFDQLIPIVIRKRGREIISVRWFGCIVNLLRGACINIILLTTGLRNFDLRSLEIGCCKPSGRVDVLNYIDADISKTNIHILLPVPGQTRKAINLLERLRWNHSNHYVIAPTNTNRLDKNKSEARVTASTINRWLAYFSKHYDIPFVIVDRNDDEFTAHCYRATVASWLDSSSNLSILLIKRLFGHTNSLMPLAYLHHNPYFIKARQDGLEQASEVMSARMAKAAEKHSLSGKRGEDLIRGFEEHKAEHKVSSESLYDKELFTTFQARIKERIMNGSMYAMMTPFGVICTRNPNDSTPTPCAKISDKDMLRESALNKELWDYMQARPNPGQCIGKACEHALLGPWSTALKDSFAWFVDFLAGRIGQELTTEELRIEAKSFVQQYAMDMQKIFGMVNSDD
ncbi:MAG: site-specific integrase [Janthinobacterium sp.]